MLVSDMINAINRRVDDVVNTADAIEWLNSAKNNMAMAIGAAFPDMSSTNLSGTCVIPAKYHEALVAYGSARFKEQDTLVQEAAGFQAQFENLKKEFIKNYSIPPQYRDDRFSQQFLTTAGQTSFYIPKSSFDPVYGQLQVYVSIQDPSDTNNSGTDPTVYTFINPILQPSTNVQNNGDGTFTLLQVATITNGQPATISSVVANQMVTAIWEEHADMAEPPYPWWNF